MNLRHLLSLILIPVFFLVISGGILEGFLRLTSYNRNFVLFSESNTHPGLVELSAKQDHPGSVFSIPFKRTKEKGSFRVFIAGGPVDVQPENPNVSFSHILSGFLQQSFPEKKIELINLALYSQNKITLYEAIRQLKTCEADLVVLGPEWKLTCDRHFLTGLRLERFVKDLTGRSSRNHSSSDFQKSLYRFEKDLDQTISFLQDHEISVIVLNTCSNLDYPPLTSAFPQNNFCLQELFEKGKYAYLNHDDEKALTYFSAVNQKDRLHAGTCYYLGKLALRNNDLKAARHFLRQAADNDLEKLRPSTGIHTIIARLSAVKGVPIIDTDNLFQLYSKNGIPGSNLFSGPQQPNLAGNIIIARECYSAILRGNYLNQKPVLDPKLLAITPFDSVYDRICSRTGLQSNLGEMMLLAPGILPCEEKIADLFAEKKITWEDSMNQLYTYYLKNKRYDQAFKVIGNLAAQNPYNVSINEQASYIASLLGDSQKVVHYAGKAFAMKPRDETARRIFIHYLKLDRPAKALPFLEYARRNGDHSLDLIYKATLQIISLKKQLEHGSPNPEIRKQIAFRYEVMGNNELAHWYRNSL